MWGYFVTFQADEADSPPFLLNPQIGFFRVPAYSTDIKGVKLFKKKIIPTNITPPPLKKKIHTHIHTHTNKTNTQTEKFSLKTKRFFFFHFINLHMLKLFPKGFILLEK